MMFRTRIFSLFAMLLVAASAPPEPAHLRDARLLVAQIQPGDNKYVHKSCFIHWKGEAGAEKYENHSDCSEFLNLLVEHSYGMTADQLNEWTGHRRPDAAQWHDAIVSGKLKRIDHLAEALPGDVLAIKFPPGLDNSGHIMIVAGPIIEHKPSAPVIESTRQWDVPIIDSTAHEHGTGDSRHKPDGTFNTGVGQGTVRIYTNADGTIAGYAWSDSEKSEYRPTSERSMVIGRIAPPVK